MRRNNSRMKLVIVGKLVEERSSHTVPFTTLPSSHLTKMFDGHLQKYIRLAKQQFLKNTMYRLPTALHITSSQNTQRNACHIFCNVASVLIQFQRYPVNKLESNFSTHHDLTGFIHSGPQMAAVFLIKLYSIKKLFSFANVVERASF